MSIAFPTPFRRTHASAHDPQSVLVDAAAASVGVDVDRSRLGRRRDPPIAVIASVIGWLVAGALQQRETGRHQRRVPAR
jgi:hypothetical protein